MLPIRPTLPPAAVYVFTTRWGKFQRLRKNSPAVRRMVFFFQRSFRHRWSVLRYVSRPVAITSTPSDPTCCSTMWFEDNSSMFHRFWLIRISEFLIRCGSEFFACGYTVGAGIEKNMCGFFLVLWWVGYVDLDILHRVQVFLFTRSGQYEFHHTVPLR